MLSLCPRVGRSCARASTRSHVAAGASAATTTANTVLSSNLPALGMSLQVCAAGLHTTRACDWSIRSVGAAQSSHRLPLRALRSAQSPEFLGSKSRVGVGACVK